MEEEIEESNDSVSLQVSMATDDGDFFRRTCPKCGLDFKTEIDNSQLTWFLAEEVKKQMRESGLSSDQPTEEIQTEDKLCCPYCDEMFSWSESFTDEPISYARRIVYRDVVMPTLENFLGNLGDAFKGNGSSGGFLSISVRFEHERESKPPRPFHGPELPDMKIVRFLCCDRKSKILEDWISTIHCIYCQTGILID